MLLALYILVPLAVLGVIAALLHWLSARRYQRLVKEGRLSPDEVPPEVNAVDMECCGQHEVCEKESLLAAISKDIEYYNDEELDRFRGRRGDEYTCEEANEFRDVLYTMRGDEVAGWVRSLQLRQLELPEELREEVLLIVGERRQ